MRLGPSLSDSATLTASSEESTLPGAAVQRVQPRDVWRSTSNADQNLVFDLGAASSYNTVAALYHNGDASALWRIRTATSEANLTAAPTYDSSTMSMRSSGDEDRYGRFHSLKDIGTQTDRWIRLDFTTLSGMTTLDVGRVMIVDALDLAPAFDWQVTFREEAFVTQTVGGTWTQPGRAYREVRWTYPGMTDTNAFAASAEIDNIAFSTPVVAAIKEDDATRQTDWVFYGIITSVSNTYHFADINMKQYAMSEFERP